jgi:SAM-dependent methyltransferase
MSTRPFTTAAYMLATRLSRGAVHGALRGEVARLNRLGEPLHVLNVGAGGTVGALIGRLEHARLTTIDVDRSRNPDAVMDVRRMDEFADGSIDQVFMMEVLEHVETPQEAIDEVRRVLRPGGTLMLSAPLAFEIHEAPGDYYRFTRHGLAWLLRDFGSVEIAAETSFVRTLVMLVLRLCMSPHRLDRAISVAAMVLFVAAFPVLWLLDRCIRTDALTKGYIVRARK